MCRAGLDEMFCTCLVLPLVQTLWPVIEVPSYNAVTIYYPEGKEPSRKMVRDIIT